MKKIEKRKKNKLNEDTFINKVEEPTIQYRTVKAIPALKDLTYNDFKKIAEKAPFSLSEWANMLHLSERTLQRYAKNESAFAPLNAERIIQIAKVLEQGKATFGKVENFYTWLKGEPRMLEGSLSIESLSSYDGIQKVLTQLGRIQHGLFA